MIKSSFVLLSALVLASGRAGGQAPGGKGADRAQLEQRFREQAAQLIQQRLALSEKQMGQLQQSNQKFAPQLTQVKDALAAHGPDDVGRRE